MAFSLSLSLLKEHGIFDQPLTGSRIRNKRKEKKRKVEINKKENLSVKKKKEKKEKKIPLDEETKDISRGNERGNSKNTWGSRPGVNFLTRTLEPACRIV